MKKPLIITALCLMLTISTTIVNNNILTYNNNNEHSYNEEKISGYEIEYEKTYIGKNSDYEVKVGISKEDGEFLGDIMQNVEGAISGINGAYFSPKAYGETSKNITWANRISDYDDYSKTKELGVRMMLGFDNENNTEIINSENNYGSSISGNKIKEGISNFPGLLKDGKIIIDNWEDDITDKMEEKDDKTFVCTDNSKNIYFGIIKDISMTNVPNVLKKLGCKNALNLDAGASTSLIYNNEYKQKSWSPVMDGIFIVKKNGLTSKEVKKKEDIKSDISSDTKYNIYQSYHKIKRFFK